MLTCLCAKLEWFTGLLRSVLSFILTDSIFTGVSEKSKVSL